jgi:fatty acid desaturase
MKIWKHGPLDAAFVVLSLGQLGATLWLAGSWDGASVAARAGGFALLVAMMTYNIIIISHLFTHVAWFESRTLNRLASMLNSINIGQSAQAYELTHVRNHHRYNNDAAGPDGLTSDTSSTFRGGSGGDHIGLLRYAFGGALSTLGDVACDLAKLFGIPVGRGREDRLHKLTSKSPDKRAREIVQLRLDRAAQLAALVVFAVISWRWTVACYLPAFYLALAMVNVQNYHEHYGAMPGNRFANSVSYYGRLYNLLTFNDGYHQEHHLQSGAHWRTMPRIRETYRAQLDGVERIVSPVPAIVGFLHRGRAQLHRRTATEAEASAAAARIATEPELASEGIGHD